MSDTPSFIRDIVQIVAGGGVASVFTYIGTRAKLGYSRDEKEVERLRTDNHKCEEMCEELRTTIELIEARLREVEFSGHDSFIARWIKDGDKIITWVNDKAYLTIFAPLGIARKNVVGRTFADLLDSDASAQIDLLDEAALAHPGAVMPIILRLAPQLPPMEILKIATTGSDGALKFEGYAFQMPDQELQRALGTIRQAEQIMRSGASVAKDDVARMKRKRP